MPLPSIGLGTNALIARFARNPGRGVRGYIFTIVLAG